jgi:hypothetical protein
MIPLNKGQGAYLIAAVAAAAVVAVAVEPGNEPIPIAWHEGQGKEVIMSKQAHFS